MTRASVDKVDGIQEQKGKISTVTIQKTPSEQTKNQTPPSPATKTILEEIKNSLDRQKLNVCVVSIKA